MKKITKEQWKQWAKWRGEGDAARKACNRLLLTRKLSEDFVFDPAKVRLEFGGFTAPKTLSLAWADRVLASTANVCYQLDNTTEEEKE